MKITNLKRAVLHRNSHFVPRTYPQPTGQGTGLGWSLSYDIVKAHGGELKVACKEGEARPDDPVGRGTAFIFLIPVETIYS